MPGRAFGDCHNFPMTYKMSKFGRSAVRDCSAQSFYIAMPIFAAVIFYPNNGGDHRKTPQRATELVRGHA